MPLCALRTFALLLLSAFFAAAQPARSRIAGPIDESRLRYLPGNTHPLARSEYETGVAPASLPMERMLLVLSPSAERQAALRMLLENQLDRTSPRYHKWLTPQQFGEQFGVSDAEISQVSGWLAASGFEVKRVSRAKNLIEFLGTAGQVASAFHTAIHQYTIGGKKYWANAADPQIPAALGSVVSGVASLHSFRAASQIARVVPEFTSGSGLHALAPGDVAAIYDAGTDFADGSGATIAVVGRTTINAQDIADFRSAFGLPAKAPQILVNGPDPGNLGGGEEAEAVLDTSWAGAIAPQASVELVVSGSTNASDGVLLSEEFIVDHNLADIMTESFGTCEANFTQAEAQLIANLAQQAAAQGITYTVSTGDSGAKGCDNPDTEKVATGPLSINMLAATPYNIAVGGTEFNENGQDSFYWSAYNNNGQSAYGYIPETVWNESCLASSCAAAAGIWAGGGGPSTFFVKPSWQQGVPGMSMDGARDIPDVSLSAAGHDPYLICLEGSCSAPAGQRYYAGISGTSAATPAFASMMALIVQYTGERQGQAAERFYELMQPGAANCDSFGCPFHDITVGNNAVPGEVNYGLSGVAYQAEPGYDLASGLGSPDLMALLFQWKGAGVATPRIRTFFDLPAAGNPVVAGPVTFAGWALADGQTVTGVKLAIDAVSLGAATYGIAREDVCAQHQSSSNCPGVGWSMAVDSDLLANGPHTAELTVETSAGRVYTSSSAFTVANWTGLSQAAQVIAMSIDTPNSSKGPVNGFTHLGGWAYNNSGFGMSQIAVAVDGVPLGTAQYSGYRGDVCSFTANTPSCPFVGWDFVLDTNPLADGPHTLGITAKASDGTQATRTASFTVLNNPGNPMTVSIGQPGVQGAPLSGPAHLGGWAIAKQIPVNTVQISIDGVSYGAANYGGNRADVCAAQGAQANCPQVGWDFVLDTTRLSNSSHVLAVKALTAPGQYVVARRPFSVLNPASAAPLVVGIDQPNAKNAILRGTATFSGWAVEQSGSVAVASVAVAVDGAPYGMAAYGVSGWTFQLDTTSLSDGPHTVTITAVSQLNGGAPDTGTAAVQFTVANASASNPTKLSIDNPNAQSEALQGVTHIGGWTFDAQSAIHQVAVSVDGVAVGNASYGGTRNDVCAVFRNAVGCPNVGWNFTLNTTAFSDGGHTLALTTTTEGGALATFATPFQIANGTQEPVRASIDSPAAGQALAGVAALGGWALDTDGAAIVRVDVLVDGEFVGNASYGGWRGDVCANYAGAGGCPNVGWNYVFDSRGYGSGRHTVEVRSVSADGHELTIGRQVEVVNQP